MPERIKITDPQKQKLIALTVASLGANPSAQGYSAETIQKHLYQAIAGLKDHITDDDDNLVNFINTCLGNIQDVTDQLAVDIENALSSAKSYADEKDLVLSERIAKNANDIATEETNRRTDIGNEATARQNADNLEKTAREEGDAETLREAKSYAEEVSQSVADRVNEVNEERIKRIEELDYSQHIDDKNNPHEVTKEQVGLSDVENKPMDDTPTYESDNYAKSGGVYEFVEEKVQQVNDRTDGIVQNINNNLGQNYQQKTAQSLATADKTIVGAINELDSAIKNASSALSFATYQALITELNSADSDALKMGTQLFIQADVPDLRVFSIESTSVSYTYTTDEAFELATQTAGGVQVGYYKLAQLKTAKVNLSEYLKFVDIVEEYDSTRTYELDEIVCVLDSTTGHFYICNTAITSPEPFNVNHWTLISVGDAIEAKTNKIIAGNANVIITRDAQGRIVISTIDTNTTYDNLPASNGGSDDSLVSTGEKYYWNNKQEKIIAGANITIGADGKTINAQDTTYEDKTAVQGGTDVSLVKTGDKYYWDNKQDNLNGLNTGDIITPIGFDLQGNLKRGNMPNKVDSLGGKTGAITLGNGLQIDSNNQMTAIAEIEVVNLL